MGSESRGSLLVGVEVPSTMLLPVEGKENDGASFGAMARASAVLTGASRETAGAGKEVANAPMDVFKLENGEVRAEVASLRVAAGGGTTAVDIFVAVLVVMVAEMLHKGSTLPTVESSCGAGRADDPVIPENNGAPPTSTTL